MATPRPLNINEAAGLITRLADRDTKLNARGYQNTSTSMFYVEGDVEGSRVRVGLVKSAPPTLYRVYSICLDGGEVSTAGRMWTWENVLQSTLEDKVGREVWMKFVVRAVAAGLKRNPVHSASVARTYVLNVDGERFRRSSVGPIPRGFDVPAPAEAFGTFDTEKEALQALTRANRWLEKLHKARADTMLYHPEPTSA